MEPTSQNNTLRSLFIFIIIGAVLLAAVVLGVRWARSRTDQLTHTGNSQTEQPAQTNGQGGEQTPQQPATSQQQAAPTGGSQVAAQPAGPSVQSATSPAAAPSHVPSTGIEDAFLPILAIAAVVFAGTMYVQSRRRLALIE